MNAWGRASGAMDEWLSRGRGKFFDLIVHSINRNMSLSKLIHGYNYKN